MGCRIEAVFFDLYGTLLQIRRRRIHREIPRALGLQARPWMEFMRSQLLTTSFLDREDFVHHISKRLAPGSDEEAKALCLTAIDEELESVEPFEGIHSLLAFLKRRGFTLGLVSNLTTLHKEPLVRFELEQYFSGTAMSCDRGVMKPKPRIYLELCRRLEVEPESVLFVGDSLKNDVLAPKALGMKALLVGGERTEHALTSICDLGWRTLKAEPERLVSAETKVRFGSVVRSLCDLAPLADSEQGRFNLVATARLEPTPSDSPLHSGSSCEVFCKRFLFPEAAYVEELMHRLLGELGLQSCDVFVHPGAEPFLVMSKAPGTKFAGSVDPPLAQELGRHSAASYIFANADLRPRNTFVSYDGTRPIVTMVDLEHCFFNLALDTTGLDDPFDPETFDRLSREEIVRRTRRKVLSERTTRRTMATFLWLDSLESEVALAFHRGWVQVFRDVQADCERLCRMLEDRVMTEPFLIIGTQSYRRSMARIDVQDIRARIAQDGAAILPRLVAIKSDRKRRRPRVEARL